MLYIITQNSKNTKIKGWEHLNSLIKTFYFRRTQRGGAVNQGKGHQSRLLPIARWLLRRTMWATGVPYEEMEQEVLARRRDAMMEDGAGGNDDECDDENSVILDEEADDDLFGNDVADWDDVVAG